MAKKTKKNLRVPFIPVTLFAIFLTISFLFYESFISDKYIPFTFIGDINVSFLTRAKATQVLETRFNQRKNQKLKLDQGFTLDLATASAKIDYSIIDSAFTHKNQVQTLFFKSINTPNISINLDSQLIPITKTVYREPIDAQIIFSETVTQEGTPSADIQIKESSSGSQLNKEVFEKNITNFLATGKFKNELPLKTIQPKITTEHVKKAKDALETSKQNPVVLKYNTYLWTIDIKQLLTILDLTSGQNLLLDKEKTFEYLKTITSQIDQTVQEGQFDFNPGTKRVMAFKPSQEGRRLDTDKTIMLITQALNGEVDKQITLPVDIIKPKVLTSDINNLGINELIGQGISRFAGSIENRIYNINLTAGKINGVLIPPGEIFSFNKTVGDITEATGFKKAYVIKEGRTVLDDGGGVCQVSTTVFRAALNTGLSIIQRTAHAYRVGYYEQGFPPGLDATVYYPSVDFQFKNDTQNHILIQAYTYGLTIYINLYGTSDGRISQLTTPIIKNQTPPPPELRQDDPALPKGTIKQVDWAAWGANVSFNRTVTRGGETLIKEVWYSNFKPWQAVYLVGTQ